MARPVVYTRGAVSVEVSATVGRSDFVSVDGYGIQQVANSVDFLFRAPDLALEGERIEPRAGDTITDAESELRYRVCQPGPGQPAWRYTDGFGNTIRVHANLTEPPAE